MSVHRSSLNLVQAARRHDLCSCLASLSVNSSRSLSYTSLRCATPTLNPTTRRGDPSQSSSSSQRPFDGDTTMATPSYKKLSLTERAERTAQRARANLQAQLEKQAGTRQIGGLADNSLFAQDEEQTTQTTSDGKSRGETELSKRSIAQMSLALNPRPNARARWQRKMVIRHIQHRGRLPRQVQIQRTERTHLAKSHFFKTSMKKLAPLARQIAGKSIDEAILQMRFSKKRAAKDVRQHLIQARDEAIVMKGMGLASKSENGHDTADEKPNPIITDPGISPPLPHQNPTKSTKAGIVVKETDIYVDEAWTNRGPYGMQPEYRARGRVNTLRPPWTGLSVVLKEEKTRARKQADKEAKSIRKRLGKNMWTQLPDRPVTKQSQYVLW